MDVGKTKHHSLLPLMAPQLDPHLLLTLLRFCESAESGEPFTRQELLEAKIAVLKKTSMVDYYIEVLTEVGGREAEVMDLQDSRT